MSGLLASQAQEHLGAQMGLRILNAGNVGKLGPIPGLSRKGSSDKDVGGNILSGKESHEGKETKTGDE